MEGVGMSARRVSPAVSVIMLTFNREEFVERAIQSVLGQTFEDFEFIIVDNGSSDSSGEIADRYARSDPRVSVSHLGKQTISAGRNHGVELASGEFVAFIDDDDYADDDMIEFLYGLAVGAGADISLCGSGKEVDGKVLPNFVFDERLVMNSEEAVVQMLKREKYNVSMPTKLVKRRLLREIPFEEGSNYDDIWSVYKLFAAAKTTVAQGTPKYCFCRHDSNNSAFTTSDRLLTDSQLEEYMKAFRERTRYLHNKLPEIKDYALYSEYSWMISMCNKIASNKLVHCREKYEYMREVLRRNFDWFYQSPYIKEFEREYMLKYIAKDYDL